MVRQVRMIEDFEQDDNTFFTRTIFGFGTFPGLTSDSEHQVTSASATAQKFRIIMDELLEGNYLQQISCRGAIDSAGDTFGSVPVGATPDDIAKCTSAADVLPVTCVGPFAVCVGPDPKHPVGVLDVNEDGAADAQRFFPGAVEIHCSDASGTDINVPIDLDNSYWNPSGDQLEPAMGGLDALGPAIVLVPGQAMPTGTKCGLVFSPTVVDKTNISVCIPPGGLPPGATDDAGDIGVGCTPTHTPADFTQFTFGVEAFRVSDSNPSTGDTGVSIMDPSSVTFNAPVDPLSLGEIAVTQAGAPYTKYTTALSQNNQRITFTWTGGLMPMTVYTITIPTSVTDAYGEPLPSSETITFTTGTT
jgi:Bacterial Ig-like domain